MSERERAEMWVAISISETWKTLVEELQESRIGYIRELLNQNNGHAEDVFYKGCLFVIDHILSRPEAAQKLLEAKPDENDELYTGMTTTA